MKFCVSIDDCDNYCTGYRTFIDGEEVVFRTFDDAVKYILVKEELAEILSSIRKAK